MKYTCSIKSSMKYSMKYSKFAFPLWEIGISFLRGRCLCVCVSVSCQQFVSLISLSLIFDGPCLVSLISRLSHPHATALR